MASRKKQARRAGGDFCSGIACRNARNKQECKNLSFFLFPIDDDRCRKWVQNTRRQDLLSKTAAELNKAGYKLCAVHFEPKQFTVPEEKKRLNWNAVPTLFNVPNPPPKVTPGRPGRKERLEPPRKKRKCLQTGPTGRRKLIPGSIPTRNLLAKSVETPKPPERKPPAKARENGFGRKRKVMRSTTEDDDQAREDSWPADTADMHRGSLAQTLEGSNIVAFNKGLPCTSDKDVRPFCTNKAPSASQEPTIGTHTTLAECDTEDDEGEEKRKEKDDDDAVIDFQTALLYGAKLTEFVTKNIPALAKTLRSVQADIQAVFLQRKERAPDELKNVALNLKVSGRERRETCCAQGCNAGRCKGVKSLFPFPAKKARCTQWLRNVGREDLLERSGKQLHAEGYKVCSGHFEPHSLLHAGRQVRLAHNAVPTLSSKSKRKQPQKKKSVAEKSHQKQKKKSVAVKSDQKQKKKSVAGKSDQKQKRKSVAEKSDQKQKKNKSRGQTKRRPEAAVLPEIKLEMDWAWDPALHLNKIYHSFCSDGTDPAEEVEDPSSLFGPVPMHPCDMGASSSPSSPSQAGSVGYVKTEPVEEGVGERFLSGSGDPRMEFAGCTRTTGHVMSDSVGGEIKSWNCAHGNCENTNCAHGNCEHTNCAHGNCEHMTCAHGNSEHRSSSDVVTGGEPLDSREPVSGCDRQTSTTGVIAEDDWDMSYTVIKAEPQSDSDTEVDKT